MRSASRPDIRVRRRPCACPVAAATPAGSWTRCTWSTSSLRRACATPSRRSTAASPTGTGARRARIACACSSTSSCPCSNAASACARGRSWAGRWAGTARCSRPSVARRSSAPVAVSSAAIWPTYAQQHAAVADAFDGPADFARNDVFAGSGRLARHRPSRSAAARPIRSCERPRIRRPARARPGGRVHLRVPRRGLLAAHASGTGAVRRPASRRVRCLAPRRGARHLQPLLRPDERLVADPVRLVGLGAEALVAVRPRTRRRCPRTRPPRSRPRTRGCASRRGRGTSDRGVITTAQPANESSASSSARSVSTSRSFVGSSSSSRLPPERRSLARCRRLRSPPERSETRFCWSPPRKLNDAT